MGPKTLGLLGNKVKTDKRKFGKVDNIILFGGGPLLSEFARFLKKSGKYSVTCFTSSRQLDVTVKSEGETLERAFPELTIQKDGIQYYISTDVCRDKRLHPLITKTTLGIGFGETWRFDRKTIDKFDGKLLDFMGIPLPRYRGGAHYSWLIMRKEKKWGCNLQLINEDMVQGVFDSGEIIKSMEYSFSPTARIPQDYFDEAVKIELDFLKEFLQEIKEGREFELRKIEEEKSIYFPRLYTLKHGFINWSWKVEDIVTFICAFDEPYKGASTFISDKKVFLKDCYSESKDGSFHPFQVGLIYRKDKKSIYVTAVDGSIVLKKITDEKGNDLMGTVKLGERLFTPSEKLEKSMRYTAVYDAKGIVDHGN